MIEQAHSFACGGARLVGIATLPERPADTGVLIVVGGPQYRAGSHRQFVLLARQLAAAGFAAFRFDYRGMGDSEGEVRGFEDVDEDIAAATDCFLSAVPQLREVVVFGLCDAACAGLFRATRDPRIGGLVLANPWARTDEGLARTYLRHYYGRRLFDRALWAKVLSGRFAFRRAASALAGNLGTAWRNRRTAPAAAPSSTQAAQQADRALPLPERMRRSLDAFAGRSLVILSDNDLTAREFRDVTRSSEAWKTVMASPRIAVRELPDANHTFSRRAWREQVGSWIVEWLSGRADRR